MDKKRWLIGISGSDYDNVFFKRVTGAKEQVKEYLFNLILEARNEGGNFDFGTESVDELDEKKNGKIYGYNCYSSSHEDFVAIPEDLVESVEL